MKLDRLLPEFSMRRPVTILMVFAALMLTGVIALKRLPLEMMPSGFNSPYLGFWVPYRDSAPFEVEQEIAHPFEDNLRSVHGLRRVETHSHRNGCWVWMEFRDGTDMDQAWSTTRDRIDRTLAELTVDIDRVVLRRMGMNDDEIYFMGISSEIPLADARQLIEDELLERIERLDGVARVDMWGAGGIEVLVDLDLEAMGRHSVSSWDVVRALSQDNFALSCGQVDEGSHRLNVRVDSRWNTVEELAGVPVRGGGSQPVQLRLSDVAQVHLGTPQRFWSQRIDQSPALLLDVIRESSGNTEEICRQIAELLEDSRTRPGMERMQISTLFSQGDIIRESMNNLQSSALWGGFFALLVLFYFLRRWRATLVVTAAIPFCILVALIGIYFLGWTLNLITMMGLMISIGMVVDNAIVVMESISIAPQTCSRREACVAGTAEVSLAVTVATLTSIVVFLPLMLMNGDSNLTFFLVRIGMPVVISLLASLGVALLFIPQLSARLHVQQLDREPRLIAWARTRVERTLAWALRHRFDATLLALALLLSMGVPMSKVEKTGEGEGHINDFNILIDMPASYVQEDSRRVVEQIEDLIYVKAEEYNLKTVTSRFAAHEARVHVWLQTDAQEAWYAYAWRNLLEKTGLLKHKRLSRDQVLEDVKERMPVIPGVNVRWSWRDFGGGDATNVLLIGPDTNRLKELADEVQRRLREMDEVVDTELNVEQGEEELQLHLDREALDRSGISARNLAGMIRYSLAGERVSYLKQGENELNVRVRLAEEDRDQLHKLGQLEMSRPDGSTVPLAELMSPIHERAMGSITRTQGRTFMRIRVYSSNSDLSGFNDRISKALVGFEMPAGYAWGFGYGFDRFQEQEQSRNHATWLAICFVFLLMGMLFESFTLPFCILASIPFAFFGAWWTLYLTKTPFDIMAGIGLIILVGVVVNNAIVLVDCVQRLRAEGVPRDEALREAVSRRFRPVIMTAATTVCGLIPMAVGNAALVGMPYAPMGRAMAGGLLTSTFFTLLVVPLLYCWVDDAREGTRSFVGGLLRRAKKS